MHVIELYCISQSLSIIVHSEDTCQNANQYTEMILNRLYAERELY